MTVISWSVARMDNGTLVNAGAVTWGNGTTGVTGEISRTNSVFGLSSNTELQPVVSTRQRHLFRKVRLRRQRRDPCRQSVDRVLFDSGGFGLGAIGRGEYGLRQPLRVRALDAAATRWQGDGDIRRACRRSHWHVRRWRCHGGDGCQRLRHFAGFHGRQRLGKLSGHSLAGGAAPVSFVMTNTPNASTVVVNSTSDTAQPGYTNLRQAVALATSGRVTIRRVRSGLVRHESDDRPGQRDHDQGHDGPDDDPGAFEFDPPHQRERHDWAFSQQIAHDDVEPDADRRPRGGNARVRSQRRGDFEYRQPDFEQYRDLRLFRHERLRRRDRVILGGAGLPERRHAEREPACDESRDRPDFGERQFRACRRDLFRAHNTGTSTSLTLIDSSISDTYAKTTAGAISSHTGFFGGTANLTISNVSFTNSSTDPNPSTNSAGGVIFLGGYAASTTSIDRVTATGISSFYGGFLRTTVSSTAAAS